MHIDARFHLGFKRRVYSCGLSAVDSPEGDVGRRTPDAGNGQNRSSRGTCPVLQPTRLASSQGHGKLTRALLTGNWNTTTVSKSTLKNCTSIL